MTMSLSQSRGFRDGKQGMKTDNSLLESDTNRAEILRPVNTQTR